MNDEREDQQPYKITISELKDDPKALVFTFVPNKHPQFRESNGMPVRVPQYVVLVRDKDSELAFEWNETFDDPGKAKADMEQEVRLRIQARTEWVELISSLVADVERWAREAGWSTRRIETKLDDAYFGKHRVPALVMQEDTCRMLLAPIGASAPGVEGIVDLYQMPAYDDIAKLYFCEGQWKLRYLLSDDKTDASTREAKDRTLSKETLLRVLEEMKSHAVEL